VEKRFEPFVWNSRIQFVDTDTSGLVHYTSVFRHVERAEHEFMRSIGFPYSRIDNARIKYPRVMVQCNYLAPMRYDDPIKIEVYLEKVGNSSFTVGFSIFIDKVQTAQAKITIVCMDTETQKAHPLPTELVETLRKFIKEID
jgi:acyl-CoA thioester hydrolase